MIRTLKPSTKRLTAKQAAILKFIEEFISANGFPPTRAEIANQFGFKSANAAEDHLRSMTRRGAISIAPGVARGIKVLSK